MNRCPFCSRFLLYKNIDKNHNSGFIVRYKATMIAETYHTSLDEQNLCGLKDYPAVPLKFCPLCGKALSNKTRHIKTTVKGLLVNTGIQPSLLTGFHVFEALFDRVAHQPIVSELPTPTEFYRFIGGKRFLVFADKNTLLSRTGYPTLCIVQDEKPIDTLCGNLFICGVNDENLPLDLFDDDFLLLRNNIITSTSNGRQYRFIQSIPEKGDLQK